MFVRTTKEGGLVCRPELKTTFGKFGSEKKRKLRFFLKRCAKGDQCSDPILSEMFSNAGKRQKKTGPEDPAFLIQLDQSGPTFA
jgi:hypothetical protein